MTYILVNKLPNSYGEVVKPEMEKPDRNLFLVDIGDEYALDEAKYADALKEWDACIASRPTFLASPSLIGNKSVGDSIEEEVREGYEVYDNSLGWTLWPMAEIENLLATYEESDKMRKVLLPAGGEKETSVNGEIRQQRLC
jgi:hypothetical protein